MFRRIQPGTPEKILRPRAGLADTYGKDAEAETPVAERIGIGLFTAGTGRDAFQRVARGAAGTPPHPLRPPAAAVRDRSKATHAAIDPCNFYIDRNAADNVLPVREAGSAERRRGVDGLNRLTPA
jgi:hypothetical protein